MGTRGYQYGYSLEKELVGLNYNWQIDHLVRPTRNSMNFVLGLKACLLLNLDRKGLKHDICE